MHSNMNRAFDGTRGWQEDATLRYRRVELEKDACSGEREIRKLGKE